jgi:hypothetical protein
VYSKVDPAALAAEATPQLFAAGKQIASYLHATCGLPLN